MTQCSNEEISYSLKEDQIVIEKSRVEYNTRRPHSALGYGRPAPAACSSSVPPNSTSQTLAVLDLSFGLVQGLGQVTDVYAEQGGK
jgi:hypothetical protein